MAEPDKKPGKMQATRLKPHPDWRTGEALDWEGADHPEKILWRRF